MGRIGYSQGIWGPEEELRVSALDRGFLLGDGLFETLRIFGGRPFLADAHFARMAAGAAALGIPLPWDESGFGKLVAEAAARNGDGDWIVRVTVTRGVGGSGYDLPDPPPAPTVVVTVREAPNLAQLRLTGIPCALATVARPLPVAAGSPKTTSLGAMVEARREARARGAAEAIYFDAAGRLLEGTATSVFVVLPSDAGDDVATPPLSLGILSGTTRSLLLSRGFGLEREVTRAEFDRAEAVILAAASMGPISASFFEGRELPTRHHSFLRAAAIFDDAVRTA